MIERKVKFHHPKTFGGARIGNVRMGLQNNDSEEWKNGYYN
jgi:hypothetical protein